MVNTADYLFKKFNFTKSTSKVKIIMFYTHIITFLGGKMFLSSYWGETQNTGFGCREFSRSWCLGERSAAPCQEVIWGWSSYTTRSVSFSFKINSTHCCTMYLLVHCINWNMQWYYVLQWNLFGQVRHYEKYARDVIGFT